MASTPLLSVKELRTYFSEDEKTVRAVDGVSFDVHRGETLGIVGESGSGKSVTNLSIMRLIPTPPGRIVGGEVLFDGRDLLSLPDREMRAVRGKRIAMIFQDPMTSLNPFMRISQQLMEVTRLHLGHSRAEAKAHAIKMLELVGIPDARRRADGYPHEFSGGMRQRVMIAMALSCQPELLIADEPTTALDVTIQAQILDLIQKLKQDTGTSVILITHDLGVVAGTTNRVIVMYAGRIFESATTGRAVRASGKSLHQRAAALGAGSHGAWNTRSCIRFPGSRRIMAKPVAGCPFADRCYRVEAICREQPPPFVQLTPDHHSLCHFAEEIYNSAR